MLSCVVTGNATRDGELKNTSAGPVLSFSVASNGFKSGEKTVTFVRCSMFGKRAESLAKHITKGSKLAVSGELSTHEHGGKTYLDLRVAEIDLMGGGKSDRTDSAPRTAPASGGGGGGFSEAEYADDMGDIPFLVNVSSEAGERWWKL